MRDLWGLLIGGGIVAAIVLLVGTSWVDNKIAAANREFQQKLQQAQAYANDVRYACGNLADELDGLRKELRTIHILASNFLLETSNRDLAGWLEVHSSNALGHMAAVQDAKNDDALGEVAVPQLVNEILNSLSGSLPLPTNDLRAIQGFQNAYDQIEADITAASNGLNERCRAEISDLYTRETT